MLTRVIEAANRAMTSTSTDSAPPWSVAFDARASIVEMKISGLITLAKGERPHSAANFRLPLADANKWREKRKGGRIYPGCIWGDGLIQTDNCYVILFLEAIGVCFLPRLSGGEN